MVVHTFNLSRLKQNYKCEPNLDNLGSQRPCLILKYFKGARDIAHCEEPRFNLRYLKN